MDMHTRRTDQLIATLEAQTLSTIDKLHRATGQRESRDTLVALRGHGTAGHASAVVDAGGLLVSVEFGPHVQQATPEQLASEVMEAVHAAQLDVADALGLTR